MLQFLAKRLNELHEVERDERGFTLIELLVVILIIAILAAIAIPVFLAQRERAWEATAQSDVRNAAAAATSCFTASGPPQTYDVCNSVAELTAFGYNRTNAVTVNGINGNAVNWSMSAQHTSGGQAATFATFGGDGVAGQVRVVARGTAAPALP
jgi:type IV pilus assembly protein PilA